MVYTLKVWNRGPAAVTGVTVTDLLSADLQGAEWACVASGTAQCTAATPATASGTGNVSLVTGNLPVNNVADIFADPHIQQRGMLANIALPEIGREATVASTPIRFAKTPGKVDHRAPRLGEHNDEILRQFKLL